MLFPTKPDNIWFNYNKFSDLCFNSISDNNSCVIKSTAIRSPELSLLDETFYKSNLKKKYSNLKDFQQNKLQNVWKKN